MSRIKRWNERLRGWAEGFSRRVTIINLLRISSWGCLVAFSLVGLDGSERAVL